MRRTALWDLCFHFLNYFSVNKQVNLHLLWTKCFGLQDIKKKINKIATKIPKGVILAQKEELSETTHATQVFPVLFPVPGSCSSAWHEPNIKWQTCLCRLHKEGMFVTVSPASKFLDDGIARKWKLLSNAEPLIFTYKYLTAEFKFDVTSKQTLHQTAF